MEVHIKDLAYPVVLVHGIIAHDRTAGRNKFWGRIPLELANSGVEVFFGNTDAWGNYESNAELLKKTIEKILLDTKKEKVNIIAHSKGGLDSRYCIWKHDLGGKIASLTTICTPHRGAELADLIFKRKIIHTKISRKALMHYGRLYGDINPDLYNVNYQLTTEKMKEFNSIVIMDSRVYCQSLYTTMKNAFDDLVLFYPYLQIKKIAGDNDGIVSEYSARWGVNTAKINGGISHTEIIDLKKRDISGIHIPGIYLEIVKELAEKGF